MKDSIHLDEEGKQYVVDIPWRQWHQHAAEMLRERDIYSNALNRLNSLKKKFLKDPILREGSFKQLHDSLNSGHSRILNKEQLVPKKGR